jgi:hypothetical protein
MEALIRTFAVNETKSIISKAIKRYAAELGSRIVENQLTIRLDKGGNVLFHRCFLYKEVEQQTFNQILGVKFDMKQREQIAVPFMQNAILKLAQENGIENFEDIKIYCFTVEGSPKNVLMYAYHKNEKLMQITWNYLFAD